MTLQRHFILDGRLRLDRPRSALSEPLARMRDAGQHFDRRASNIAHARSAGREDVFSDDVDQRTHVNSGGVARTVSNACEYVAEASL